MTGYEYYGSNRKKRGRIGWRLFWGVLDTVLFVLTLACSILLAGAYLAGYVDPDRFWVFSVLGLIAPFLYLTELMLALYWIVRWRRHAILPLLLLLAGAGYVKLYFKPDFERHYQDAAPARDDLVVMSYNVHGFVDNTLGGTAISMDSVGRFIASVSPDILCLQEFQVFPNIPKSRVDSLLPELEHSRVSYVSRYPNGTDYGVAIYSKYPIIRFGEIVFEESNNRSMWADVIVRRDTLRVFNNHLQTTAIDNSDREYIIHQEFIGDSEREKKTRNILRKLHMNNRIRARQADTVARLISLSPYKVIVCGDFNDTPMSYAYRTVRDGLSDAFVEKGRGAASTYRGLFNMFRIDYILHSPELETTCYVTYDTDRSDHNPIAAGLKLQGSIRNLPK